jgi:hypothetical protein
MIVDGFRQPVPGFETWRPYTKECTFPCASLCDAYWRTLRDAVRLGLVTISVEAVQDYPLPGLDAVPLAHTC